MQIVIDCCCIGETTVTVTRWRSKRAMNIDDQGRLRLQVRPSTQACDECGTPGPENRAWQLLDDNGVLCRSCLSRWIEETNRQLGVIDSAPKGYKVRAGDLYVQEVRENQWNLYQFIDHAWQYLFTISQAEIDTYISQLQMMGETDGVLGKRRYYRPFNPVLYRPRRSGRRPRH